MKKNQTSKKEAIKSIKRTKEYEEKKEPIFLFVFGVLFGIFGSILATGFLKIAEELNLEAIVFALALILIALLGLILKKHYDKIASDLCDEKCIPFSFTKPNKKYRKDKI